MASDQTLTGALSFLRETLLSLPAAGADGFEGLVATAVADCSGLQIRLAKSGLQFGRDASSPVASFSLAVEAKRYDNRLRLEHLAGKLSLASFSMGSDTDLWLLGTTSEIGDDIIRKLPELARASGMAVVFLDWSLRPLPALAVLLASTQEATLRWICDFQPVLDTRVFESSLRTVSRQDTFTEQKNILKQALTATENGLDALRARNASWLRARLQDPILSRQSFNQTITPFDPNFLTLNREDASGKLSQRVRLQEGPAVVAVLGEEGTGKTWLTLDLWRDAEAAPIVIPVIGKRVDRLDSTRPIESLAALLAEDYRDAGGSDPEPWIRRLERWSRRMKPKEDSPRFAVILDGLNERADVAWADTIVGLSKVVYDLGGVFLVTSRPSFWQREVLSRIAPGVRIQTITVGGYTPDEVDQLLRQTGGDPSNVSETVRAFLRNPRVCSVAIRLLSALTVSAGELTKERLFLEYWKHRMVERGDLVAHTDRDFQNLLKEHAREWRERPTESFTIDDWRQKSGLVRRNPTAQAINDLSYIIEGQFMESGMEDDGAYRFKPETLPFALGLLLVDTLRSQPNPTLQLASETIDGWLDPIRSFDLTSRVVLASFGLACLNPRISGVVREALLGAWVSLQNVDPDAEDSLFPYIKGYPEPVLDLLVRAHTANIYSPHLDTLTNLLLEASDNDMVRAALYARLSSWLGRWTVKELPFPGRPDPPKDRETVRIRLAQLDPKEREEFETLCREVSSSDKASLDELAVMFLSAIPRAPMAKAIWAWCLKEALAPNLVRVLDDLSWAILLNPIDWSETAEALAAFQANVTASNSSSFRKSADIAGRLLVRDTPDRILADTDPESTFRQAYSRVKTFCNTNPHDPTALECDNLQNAIQRAETLEIDQLRVGRFSTVEDNDLKTISPALVRFAPDVILNVVRALVRSIENRSEMPLWSLTWELTEYSPLFDEACVVAVKLALASFRSTDRDWSNAEDEFAVNALLRSLFPHVTAIEQLNLLLASPAKIREFVTIDETFKPLTPEELEAALETAVQSGESRQLERVLLFASGANNQFTGRSREIIKAQLGAEPTSLSGRACNLISNSDDSELHAALLAYAASLPIPENNQDENFLRSQAFAHVVIKQRRPDLLWTIDPGLRGAVASDFDGDVISQLSEHTESAIQRLLQPIAALNSAPPPSTLETTPSGLGQRINFVNDGGDGDLGEILKELSDPDGAASKYSEQQGERIHQYRLLNKQLSAEGAQALLDVPMWGYLTRLVEVDPQRVRKWLNLILTTEELAPLRQIFNIGMGLAGTFAYADGKLASSVIRHLSAHRPLMRVITEREQIPLLVSAIFAASEAREMESLREEFLESALSNHDLETAIRAARRWGSADWLMRYIMNNSKSANPADQARSLALAGFCYPDQDVSAVFAIEHRSRFLNTVSSTALKNRTRAMWAADWCSAALQAQTPEDFWCRGKLAEGVVDLRFTQSFETVPDSTVIDLYGGNCTANSQRRPRNAAREEKIPCSVKRPRVIVSDSPLRSVGRRQNATNSRA